MSITKPKRELINELRENGIFQTLDTPITLKSGRKSTFYADFRKLYTNPLLLNKVANFLTAIVPTDTHYLAGSPLGAIPITTLLSQKLRIPFLLVRPQAKSHGTKRLVEGDLSTNPTANITIIEDVITSGTSTLETYNKLKATYPHANITKVVSIFDRQSLSPDFPISQITNLPLLTITEVFPPSPSPTTSPSIELNNLLIKYYTDTQPPSPHATKLIKSLTAKQSNIIFSADLTTQDELLKTLIQVAPHIVAVKLHTDTFKEPITPTFTDTIQSIAKKNNLLIIEDRKFTDIGSTLTKQLTSHLNIASWADAVTVFPCITKKGIEIINSFGISPLIIEQLSSYKEYDDNPYLTEYQRAFASTYHSFQSHKLFQTNFTTHSIPSSTPPTPPIQYLGSIGQTKTPKWQFTPAISLTATKDTLNQNYRTPEQAAQQGADFFIIGRAIYDSENPAETAQHFRTECWRAKLKTITST